MRNISIDIETFSDIDLNKCGVYRYAESKAFGILLCAYSVDGGEVKVIDLTRGEKIPNEILDALTNDTVIKWAFNANFERVCLSRYMRDKGILGDEFLNPKSWRCSMIWAAYMGMPQSLKDVGALLGLEKQKTVLYLVKKPSYSAVCCAHIFVNP